MRQKPCAGASLLRQQSVQIAANRYSLIGARVHRRRNRIARTEHDAYPRCSKTTSQTMNRSSEPVQQDDERLTRPVRGFWPTLETNDQTGRGRFDGLQQSRGLLQPIRLTMASCRPKLSSGRPESRWSSRTRKKTKSPCKIPSVREFTSKASLGPIQIRTKWYMAQSGRHSAPDTWREESTFDPTIRPQFPDKQGKYREFRNLRLKTRRSGVKKARRSSCLCRNSLRKRTGNFPAVTGNTFVAIREFLLATDNSNGAPTALASYIAPARLDLSFPVTAMERPLAITHYLLKSLGFSR